jgi:Kazal-type serine protease inhibitor domain
MTVVRVAPWAALAILASALPAAAAQPDPQDTNKRRPTVCTEQYEPVCGRIKDVRKTYSNRCYARADGADIVAQGRCASPKVEPGPR